MASRWGRLWSGLALLAIFSSLALLFYLWGRAVNWGDRLEAGEPVPDAALAVLEARPPSRGSSSLVVFVDCDCPSCSALLEELGQHPLRTGPDRSVPGLTFVSRSRCEPLARLDPPFRVLIDDRGGVFHAFGIWQVPSVLEIDGAGRIVESRFGWNVDELVLRHINRGR